MARTYTNTSDVRHGPQMMCVCVYASTQTHILYGQAVRMHCESCGYRLLVANVLSALANVRCAVNTHRKRSQLQDLLHYSRSAVHQVHWPSWSSSAWPLSFVVIIIIIIWVQVHSLWPSSISLLYWMSLLTDVCEPSIAQVSTTNTAFCSVSSK